MLPVANAWLVKVGQVLGAVVPALIPVHGHVGAIEHGHLPRGVSHVGRTRSNKRLRDH